MRITLQTCSKHFPPRITVWTAWLLCSLCVCLAIYMLDYCINRGPERIVIRRFSFKRCSRRALFALTINFSIWTCFTLGKHLHWKREPFIKRFCKIPCKCPVPLCNRHSRQAAGGGDKGERLMGKILWQQWPVSLRPLPGDQATLGAWNPIAY